MEATIAESEAKLDRRLARWIFILVLTTTAYFYQAGEHNESVRFDQTRAIVELGQLYIDPFAYNSADVVPFRAHIYPLKAPGASLAAIPVWWLTRVCLRHAGVGEARALELTCYLVTVVIIGGASAALAALLFCAVTHRLKDRLAALVLSLSFAFGTIAFPFSTVFFSHQLAAFCLFSCFILLLSVTRSPHLCLHFGLFELAAAPPVRLALAGILGGYALVSEYPSLLPLLVLSIYAMFALSRRQFLWYCAGLVAPAAVLIAHNLIIAGDPFFLPYQPLIQIPDSLLGHHKQGIFGVGLPHWDALTGLTFGVTRGLFACNPWLVAVIPALAVPLLRPQFRREALLVLAIIVVTIIYNAGFGNSIYIWGGFQSTGPRYLVPVLPFIVYFAAPLFASRTFMLCWSPLILVSVAFMTMATTVEPRAPMDYYNPMIDFHLKNFLAGRLALLDHGIFSTFWFTEDSTAFNLGKLFRWPPPLQLLPLFAWWLAVMLPLFRLAGGETSRRAALLAQSLAVLLVIALAAAPMVYQAHAAQPAADSGLAAVYYRGILPTPSLDPDPPDTGQFRILTRNIEPPRIENSLNLPVSTSFSAEWRGQLSIQKKGAYIFALESDDGSALYLDDKLVINNWGEHSLRRLDAKLPLNVGEHAIVVRYFNAAGGAVLRLFWRPPGEHLRIIEREVLRPIASGESRPTSRHP